jgi:hypothetical protein
MGKRRIQPSSFACGGLHRAREDRGQNETSEQLSVTKKGKAPIAEKWERQRASKPLITKVGKLEDRKKGLDFYTTPSSFVLSSLRAFVISLDV